MNTSIAKTVAVLSLLTASVAHAEKAKDGASAVKCQGANACKGKGGSATGYAARVMCITASKCS